MAALIGKKVEVKKYGVSPEDVPDNPKAKLMYYLYCVSHMLELDDNDINRLTNFEEYYLLSNEETKALLALVIILRPDELIGKVFYPNDEGIVGFYEISEVEHMLAALTESILIGGKQTNVTRVMFITLQWIEKFYLTPITQLPDQIERENARAIEQRARREMRMSRLENARERLENEHAMLEISRAKQQSERERLEHERSRQELSVMRQELDEARKEIAQSRHELSALSRERDNKCCVIL